MLKHELRGREIAEELGVTDPKDIRCLCLVYNACASAVDGEHRGLACFIVPRDYEKDRPRFVRMIRLLALGGYLELVPES